MVDGEVGSGSSQAYKVIGLLVRASAPSVQQAELHVSVFVASALQVLLLSAAAAVQQQDLVMLHLSAVSSSLPWALWNEKVVIVADFGTRNDGRSVRQPGHRSSWLSSRSGHAG